MPSMVVWMLIAPRRKHRMPSARLLHCLLWRHHRRVPLVCADALVRVEKLLGDLKRAELAVPSEDSMVLGMIEAVSLGWKEMHRRIGGSSRCAGIGGGSRWVEMGKVHEAGEGTGPGARRQCACSAFLLIGFFATASLELCS